MAVYNKKFNQYRIWYRTVPEVPVIDCYDTSTTPEKHVGKLSFHEGALPANLVSASEVLYLRYKLSQFNDIISILRLEKPLYVCLTTTTMVGYIGTDQGEPVGEEEA